MIGRAKIFGQAGTELGSVPAPLYPEDSLEAVPLYAPAGALLPMKLAQQYVGDLLINPLTLAVFPADKGATSSSKCALLCSARLCSALLAC